MTDDEQTVARVLSDHTLAIGMPAACRCGELWTRAHLPRVILAALEAKP